jgi:hypothetical protein
MIPVKWFELSGRGETILSTHTTSPFAVLISDSQCNGFSLVKMSDWK